MSSEDQGEAPSEPSRPEIRVEGVRASPSVKQPGARQANWEYWQQIISTQLWKAVVLTFNVDPRDSPGHPFTVNGYLNGRTLFDRQFESLVEGGRDKYQEKIDIALSHLINGNLDPLSLIPGLPINSDVALADFAAWALQMKWSIPSEFVAMAQPLPHTEKVAISESTVPTERHVSKKAESSMLNIIGALCELYWREIREQNDRDIIQAKIIERIQRTFPRAPGLSERNLKEKISAAIVSIRNSE